MLSVWCENVRPLGAGSTATVHDVAYSSDGGVFVVGEFTGTANVDDTSGGVVRPLASLVGVLYSIRARLKRRDALHTVYTLSPYAVHTEA